MEDHDIVDIASAIQVRHILTSISKVRPILKTAPAGGVKGYLTDNLFDFTPIWSASDASDGRGADSWGPDGLLRRVDLDAARDDDEIGSFVRPLTSDILIGAKASINELIDRFRAHQAFMLVVGSQGLEGVVTPSDLNKQAGRTQLFLQLSALELALAEVMRASTRSIEQTLDLLPARRASQVRGRYERQIRNDAAADLVTAFDLRDLLHAWKKEQPAVASLTSTQIQGLSMFRNAVMHAVLRPAGDDERKLSELLDQTELVSELLAAIDVARQRSEVG